MPGRKTAKETGTDLERRVIRLVEGLELEARHGVRVGRRLWGNVRIIDVVARAPGRRRRGVRDDTVVAVDAVRLAEVPRHEVDVAVAVHVAEGDRFG